MSKGDTDKAEQELILILRRGQEQEEDRPHGIWKIAYADFMTALMAFFLIMWLLNISDQEQRSKIASYFNPVKLADASRTRKGVHNPQETSPEDEDDGQSTNPLAATNSAETGASDTRTGDATHAAKPRYAESALFQDPYAILARLADDTEPDVSRSTATGRGASDQNREVDLTVASVPAVIHDPFDPAFWRMAPQGQPIENTEQPPPTSETPVDPAPDSPPAADKEQREIAEIRENITDALKQESAASGIDVKRTDGGILISLNDEDAFSMFASGSAEPKPEVVRALGRIGKLLAERKGNIIVRGHTDSVPFRSENYDNWRLSSARAHMAAYMLIRGGIDQSRIERIEGHADRLPFNEQDTKAAENRRIEIMLKDAGE